MRFSHKHAMAEIPSLTDREQSVMHILAQQRAVRLDHLPRYLAQLSEKRPEQPTRGRLHRAWKSEAHNLVEHLHQGGLLHLHRLGDQHSPWIWLTKGGVQALGLPSTSWSRPAPREFALLYARSSVRLLLSEADREGTWISQHDLPDAGHADAPDAEFVTSGGERIAIVVCLRLPPDREQVLAQMQARLQRVVREGPACSPLVWYYYAPPAVGKQLRSARTLLAQRVGQPEASRIHCFSYPVIRKLLLYREHTAPVCALACAPDGISMASGGADGLRIWDLRTGTTQITFPARVLPVQVGWSCFGRKLVVAEEQGVLSLLSLETQQVQILARNDVSGFCCSPLQDDRLAVALQGGRVQVMEVGSQSRAWEQVLQGEEGVCLAFSADGRHLAVGTDTGSVLLLDAVTGRLQQRYQKHPAAVAALCWSPESRLLASCGKEEVPTISLWEAASGKRRRSIHSDLSCLRALCWSPDDRIAAGGAEGAVRVWEVASGRLCFSALEHADAITGLAWAQTGTWLISASRDGTVQVVPMARGSRADRQRSASMGAMSLNRSKEEVAHEKLFLP